MPSNIQSDLTSMTTTNPQTVQDINLISTFLANSQVATLNFSDTPRTASTASPQTINPTTLILAPSAILHQATYIFTQLQATTKTLLSSRLKRLILTGGTGHSTTHLYTAIQRHPTYNPLASLLGRSDNDLTGLSEAYLLSEIFRWFHDGERVCRSWDDGRGLKVLVEGNSTNCGENARFSRDVLEKDGMVWGADGDVDDVVIVQDPTMSLRTKASFEKVCYDDVVLGKVRFWTWPVFVPKVKVDHELDVVWDGEGMEGVDVKGLWDLKRFYGLILGEVVRLRNDEGGYGPKGKGFIVRVDVPDDVEAAWSRLSKILDFQR